MHNLLAAEFQGIVYAVNRDAPVVQSLPGYRSIGEIGAPVDLAVVVVPAASVVLVAHECAVAGVRALLVISAGFGEAGDDGARRQGELVELCRETGMRLVGPNCLGVVNTAPEVRLNATFAPRQPARGRIGFMSQSGSFGIAIMEAAERLGVGLSSFVSIGNKVDLTGNEFLQYWEEDPLPTSRCCTSSRWRTRGSSRAWPAGSPGLSRFWRLRAVAPRQGRGRRARTEPVSRPPTSRSTPCSSRPE